ncbi:DUF721 domain-containing protein [candidate division KSB1 bacterium]
MMGTFKSKPESLGGILKKLFSDIGIDKSLKQQEAVLIWEEVVGDAISKVSTPESVEHGRLYVKVQNNVWKQEIHYHKLEIIKRINERLRKEVIKDIIFL